MRFALFLVFGLITATPYLVYNFDAVPQKVSESGASGWLMVFEFFKALTATTLKGMSIGLSTFTEAVFHIATVISEKQIGTMIFALVVVLFATASLFQPTRLFFNIIDMQKGRQHGRGFIILISAVIVVFVAAPLCWLFTGGETITSGLQKEIISGDKSDSAAMHPQNDSINDSEIIKSLNMLEGGAK